MLTVNVMINVMIPKYGYGNGLTVMDPISGTTL